MTIVRPPLAGRGPAPAESSRRIADPDPRRRDQDRSHLILLVEDEPSLAETIAYLLRSDGFLVVSVGTGPEGLDAFRTRAPDLILLDLMIPGINGLEVCRTIRRSSTVPIIMVTARATELDKVVGLEAGADDYLTKPFSIAELRARIDALLRHAAPTS